MSVDTRLLEIVVCPACRSRLVESAGSEESEWSAGAEGSAGPAHELTCTGCGLAYPVRDDIPVLLVDEARRPG